MTDPMPLSTPALSDPIFTRITGLIARSKSLDPAALQPSTSFDELEIDSLDKINLTFEIEEIYEIQIPDDSLNSLRTIGDVVVGVERLLAGKTQTQP